MDASDPAAAAAWLWKATSRGNPVAPVRLADMYIKGQGVPRSCEQALVLLRSAATKENAPARNRLAALYANGTCVATRPGKGLPVDVVRACCRSHQRMGRAKPPGPMEPDDTPGTR